MPSPKNRICHLSILVSLASRLQGKAHIFLGSMRWAPSQRSDDSPRHSMTSTGPQWSLYPLLAIIAFSEFAFGVVHLTFCLPLYFFLFPIINGTLGLLAAFHAIFLRYPNKCDFYLQVISSVVSFWFFISSVIETYCLGWFANLSEEHNDGICYGLKYRTISLVGSCMDFLGQLQMLVLMKLGWEPKDRDSIRFFVSCCLTILALIHLCSTTALSFFSAIETKMRLYSYHYQVVTGMLISFTGIFHIRYCCTFFFTGLPLAVGIFSIVQGTVSWRSKCHGSWARSLNIFGAGTSLLLFAATAFGVFCWFHRDEVPEMITRHCHWFPESEAYCHRVVHFSQPYIDWLPEETDREIAVVQIVVHSFLIVLSLLQFGFSMRSAFTTKMAALYY